MNHHRRDRGGRRGGEENGLRLLLLPTKHKSGSSRAQKKKGLERYDRFLLLSPIFFPCYFGPRKKRGMEERRKKISPSPLPP